MRVDDWLAQATAKLRAAEIPSARLDCLLFLEDATARDRAWLLAHPEHHIVDRDVALLNKNITRRQHHIPLSYIRGHTEFYGRRFYVNKHVLQPRPESETIINLLLKLPLGNHPVIIDVGTGSGALAISSKLEIPGAAIVATDIDMDCLRLAERNAAALEADIATLHADLLMPLSGGDLPSWFETAGHLTDASKIIILANLPYVPADHAINQAAMHEPKLAIFGGPDGLDPYRRMFDQISNLPLQPAFILTESLAPQHAQMATLARDHGYVTVQSQDLIQVHSSI
jgi:release factor glutamine methyltransferase